ncbi:MAG: Gfo/Idh/MocA family oxidoreductase [Nitrospirae bacterium]|nr:Gfo/Idh/MocA family oxidoreductase [Nitrospirota bacterium]
MEKIKVGVVGVGYLGQHHARIYSELKDVELVGVVDTDIDRAKEIAKKFKTQAFSSHKELIGKVKAVSIVAPTSLHHAIAKDFLEAGIDVMLEKPITVTVEEADDLIAVADRNSLIFQVGHLERFNSAVMKMVEMTTTPKFIECNRLSPFPDRSTDVDVVLDLMIHDIDIILSLVQSPVKSISAVGIAVISQNVDIANARMEFESGCVANITSSRISLKKERKIRLFQPDTYISLNYQDQEIYAYHRIPNKKDPEGKPDITGGKVKVVKEEPLKAELAAFAASVRDRSRPLVSGREGREALEVAMRVQKEIQSRSVI